MTKRLAWIGMVLALVAGACGDDGTATAPDDSTTTTTVPSTTSADGGEPDPATTEPPALTASWKGVTEDTVSIAVSVLDFDVLKDLGLQDFGWGDQRLIWEFYLDRLNERGGVAGRQVDYVLDFYNPALAIDAEASCLRMTEDRDVFAVLGAFLGPAESATPCLTNQEDLVVFEGTMTVELLEGAKSVWVISGSAGRRRIPIFFELLDQAGFVDGQRVAVVSGNENERDSVDVIEPILRDLGLDIVVTSVNTSSTDDVVAEDQYWDRTAELIRTENADVIVINGDTTGAIRGIHRNDLQQELWVVTGDQLANLGTTVDRSDADGAITLAGVSSDEAWEEPGRVACAKEFTDAYPDAEVRLPSEVGEGDERWDIAIAQACTWIAVFETVMNAAGPELTPDSVQAAYEGLGDVELPGFTYASWGPGKPDANDGFRLSEWDSTAGENGSLVPITELLDATP
ncbi:MAG: ABC transporter substrate-binding protein [Acidimicrobiales bacterium]|nr:ABC transporter substrate-binding protein [Acidimicrobiales bacterium]